MPAGMYNYTKPLNGYFSTSQLDLSNSARERKRGCRSNKERLGVVTKKNSLGILILMCTLVAIWQVLAEVSMFACHCVSPGNGHSGRADWIPSGT
jgi:hypothetical protein